ncbi:MAG: hypothetical protein V1904_15710 [Bacteroidota bacterium]
MFFLAAGCLQNNNCTHHNNGASADSFMIPSVFYKKGIGVNVTHKLTLINDSAYSEHSRAVSDVDRSMATSTYAGKYKIYQNKLMLNPRELLSFDFQGNHMKTEITDSILKKSYYLALSYDIVKYKNLVLLLNDSSYDGHFSNDYTDIANAINEHDGKDELYYIYRNADNSSFSVDKDISKSFPSPWNEYIMDTPVKGKVTGIKKADSDDRLLYEYLYIYSEYIFTLDIGTTDGLRNGMKLYSTGKDSCSCEMTIMETEKDQCKGYMAPFYETNCISAIDYSTKRK